MDDQRKDDTDPKGPKQRTRSKQLQTNNLPTDDVKHINSTKRKEIYYSLTSCRLFPEEQKWCSKGSRGTADLLYIDQHILNESKTRRKNLAIAWIDYKKAYMVPQSWIINCLKMYNISDEVINFIEKTMKTWRVEFTAGWRSLAGTTIQRRGVIYKALCFDVAQGRMNGAPNETRTHSCRFASLAC